MATKLRAGDPANDITITNPSGSGNEIFYDDGSGSIGIYTLKGTEGSDTIYELSRREPKASNATPGTDAFGTDG